MHFTAADNEWMRLTVAWISFVLVDLGSQLEPVANTCVRTAAEKVLHVQKDKKNTKVLSDKTYVTASHFDLDSKGKSDSLWFLFKENSYHYQVNVTVD